MQPHSPFLVLALASSAAFGAAQDPYQVADLVPGIGSGSPSRVVDMGPFVVFRARDGVHGFELWRSDGNEAGTVLLLDVWPGPDDGVWIDPVGSGGLVYFRGAQPATGGELWRSDGTTAGTVLVADVWPGAGGSLPDELTDVGGRLFFTAQDPMHGVEVWTLDGSGQPVPTVDVFPGTQGSAPRELTPFAGELYWTAMDAPGNLELWRSDGLVASKVREIHPGTGSVPAHMTVSGGALFFSANDGLRGTELWKTDGTAGGTVLVADIRPGPEGSSIDHLTDVDGTLFFVADDGVSGQELWKSDGTPGGTALVTDFIPGAPGSQINSIVAFDGAAFVVAYDGGTFGQEPWRSDGVTTTLLKDIRPGPPGSLVTDMTPHEGVLYFGAGDSAAVGVELWRSDGTPAGTERVADLAPSGSSYPYRFVSACGRLWFCAERFANGRELWALETAVETYCTAKASSCGTLPTMAWSGFPSAAATSGFVVRAENAKAGKAGLLLYTDAGRANAPFQGGTLCLDTPLRRSVAVVDAAGTPPACDGVLALDLSAFAAGLLGGNPLPSLRLPGTVIDCQFWGRDTPGVSLLSDALEYTVCP